MSEKRFTFGAVSPNVAMIKDNGEPMDIGEVVDLLNEQQATNDYLEESNSRLQVQLGETLRLVDKLKEENEKLRQQLKEKEEDEQLYANEIVKLNKEAKEVLDFKNLGGDY